MQRKVSGRQDRRHARRPEVERFPQGPMRCGRRRGARRGAGRRRRRRQPSRRRKPANPPRRRPRRAGPAVFPSAVDPKYSKETAGKARMHTCVDQWKANKAANTTGGMKWIQKGGGYCSECNKKLKGPAAPTLPLVGRWPGSSWSAGTETLLADCAPQFDRRWMVIRGQCPVRRLSIRIARIADSSSSFSADFAISCARLRGPRSRNNRLWPKMKQ